ncbi:hypothetical protein BDW62DRAFT_202359 [Aspergillus aurantiobrunneus]
MYLHFDPAQHWYYVSRQRPEEVLLLKIFDSADVRATLCPHASIIPEGDGGMPRRSIEVRAFVFGGSAH